MSQIEAMVHLALEGHQIPFSWRWFDGESPTYTQLLANQGFQPEFTLRETKTVILVQGGFFGTLPGVLDKVALAQVAFEEDGWKVAVLWDSDIRSIGAWELLMKSVPAIASVHGPLRPNPYGHPDSMSRNHASQASRPINPKIEHVGTRGSGGTSGNRRAIRRGGNRNADSGRSRVGKPGISSGYKAR